MKHFELPAAVGCAFDCDDDSLVHADQLLGDRIAAMWETGVTPTSLTPPSYDSDDDDSVDPSADIRTDRFDLMDTALRMSLDPPAAPGANVAPAALPADPAPAAE